ncbi:unnamed protein product [Mycena citricolor]|uniref:AAA+ ATPase domain-containing protein n=1 Tax=Mycena citricolor TaxID=2018698 RepID=A0AAD2H5F0_9AGAR|nr:unnamed protein product [Mycena citricolor]
MTLPLPRFLSLLDPSPMDDDARLSRLNKLFISILHGTPLTRHNTSRFLEALRCQADPVSCVNRIISNSAGLSAIQAAMRSDLSDVALNGQAADTIAYFQAPDLGDINGGAYLNQILRAVVGDPPIFWDALVAVFKTEKLSRGLPSFAWLLYQLCRLPDDDADPYLELARAPEVTKALIEAADQGTRSLGYKIQHLAESSRISAAAQDDIAPGGRHDNDCVDYRKIAILPTADELACTEPPFLRPTDPSEVFSTPEEAVPPCLDGQFRLLREDMLYEMREELQIAFGHKKGRHRGLVIEGFKVLDDIFTGADDRSPHWGIQMECTSPLWFLKKVSNKKKFFVDNRQYFKHQSYTCLIVDNELVAFPMIHRDEDLLSAAKNPVIVLQFEGETSMARALLRIKKQKFPSIKLIQIDTAIFAYEPVLKALQRMRTIPLAKELLCWTRDVAIEMLPDSANGVVRAVKADPRQNLGTLLRTTKPIILDESQAASLLSGLTQPVSLIQGPPGTGKSFIGALLARILHDAQQKILVVCYTNHALDQFLEDILDIGVPQGSIVRLGGKSTPRTEPLSLSKQTGGSRLSRLDWQEITSLKSDRRDYELALDRKWKQLQKGIDILTHIEFEDEDFYEALSVPEDSDGMSLVGQGGKQLKRWYLLNRWNEGKDAGMFKSHPQIVEAAAIWHMPPAARNAKMSEWTEACRKARVEEVAKAGKHFNRCQSELDRLFGQKQVSILRSKRIIGCTTNAAAKYTADIQASSIHTVIVEEAGEILESHVLTALTQQTKQLILIGDHKQLRPKVNNYQLTVEKGEGFDLNRSLFERLVLKGYPHQTLSKQHRMRPEISALVRCLTYPDLVDAPGTLNRPNVRGVRDNLVFIDHDKPEDDDAKVQNAHEGAKSSKRNSHEAKMVLKIIKYLGQQGYGTDKLVVLTPYLGQLKELMSVLSEENDPVLNDLDTYDLVSAGLSSEASAKISRRKLRLATIDNYQGEESDIVVSSLTRSNSSHDIGFMFSPERLNVLLSRPRNAFIMIGNSDTFLHSRKGKDLWGRFFGMMKEGGHIYDGLPVKCERHPDRVQVLRSPVDFDNECPDGGCKEPCGTMLNCGQHTCPSKCHQLADHSKMECKAILNDKCAKSHPLSWKCFQKRPITCVKCDREAKLAEERQKRDFELQRKRDEEQARYVQELAEIDAQMAIKKQEMQDARAAEERARVIAQKKKDLEGFKASTATVISTTPPPAASHVQTTSPTAPLSPRAPVITLQPSADSAGETKTTSHKVEIPVSDANLEWQRQKDFEGARNDSIDSIMEMIGLEDVKSTVLDIKAKIDTSVRQNISLRTERFNTTLLGNPGTGKTTVARHYAKFLASVGVIPGTEFVETTGSRLSNEGVPGTKKILEDVLNAGGGTIFVDEAYQLTGLKSYQGPQVLDFLLAEMENNVGKLVFIFAGYEKEMETFFEHNPGLTSRVPFQLKFADYTDSELLGMLTQLVKKNYGGKMMFEGGMGGLYSRIAVRRLGRGRGRPGFGNARAVENVLQTITRRQASRIALQRKQGSLPDDFLLTAADLIGPDPSKAMKESDAWVKLQKLTGLDAVKDSVRSLLQMIETNYLRELEEKEPLQMSLNQVFFGSPGTGKTTVAGLYGQILADLGLLSKAEVVVKNPSDFVGDVLGASESKTKAILAATVGKVLVIDEAYMLYGANGGGGVGNQNDPFKTAVIDTIVAEVQNVPGDDRCVLMLGYEKEMMAMFQNVNPGLTRRFNVESPFVFHDFTDPQLLEILNSKLAQQHLGATEEAKQVAIAVVARERIRPNFGNAGAVTNLLTQAKRRCQSRRTSATNIVFQPRDFDPDFDRHTHAASNLAKLFEEIVGCEEIVSKLSRLQTIAENGRRYGKDARDIIPTAWVFKGPPGTGKTTIARKLGQIYFDMGILSSNQVEECSASDLVGQYVGQTGPKTAKLFEKALGKVLFIDEAYRLCDGAFGKEAVNEIVALLTDPRFQSKLVIVLAGYDDDINGLLAMNPGLSSRFKDEMAFRNMSPEHCLDVFRKTLGREKVELSGEADHEILVLIGKMTQFSSWGNARDMKSLAKDAYGAALMESIGDKLCLSSSTALKLMQAHLDSLRRRNAVAAETPLRSDLPVALPTPIAPIRTTVATRDALPEAAPDMADTRADGRDPGVSNAVWEQLESDKKAAESERRKHEKAIKEAERLEREAEALQLELEAQKQRERAQAELDELKRILEEARLRELHAREERERRDRELRKEIKAQAALRRMGVCVAGFQWIKQAGGYRCAGGAHFVSDAQIEGALN